MKKKTKYINTTLVVLLMSFFVCCSNKQAPSDSSQSEKIHVEIILGSTRQGRSSEKIATTLKNIASRRNDLVCEIADLRSHNLPFFNDEIAPANRKEITDPAVQKWSDTITRANAFIIILPEYNAGYPGVLKNALDTLYKEWNNKPVGFVSYSGGASGGSVALSQLKTVTNALKMGPVSPDIKIPFIWKAFNEDGIFVDQTIESQFNAMIDHILEACS